MQETTFKLHERNSSRGDSGEHLPVKRLEQTSFPGNPSTKMCFTSRSNCWFSRATFGFPTFYFFAPVWSSQNLFKTLILKQDVFEDDFPFLPDVE